MTRSRPADPLRHAHETTVTVNTRSAGPDPAFFLRARHGSRGFSLIELLVVVFIIGLFAGMAVLSLNVVGVDRELEREALRLQSLLDTLMDEAVLQTRDYGVLFTNNGYRFFVYDYPSLSWLDPVGDEFLREHRLTEPLAMTLFLEDREVVLDSEYEPEFGQQPQPQVVLLASGGITPFEARLFRDPAGGRYLLEGTLDGSLEVTRSGFDES